jgi:hypothetical protein
MNSSCRCCCDGFFYVGEKKKFSAILSACDGVSFTATAAATLLNAAGAEVPDAVSGIAVVKVSDTETRVEGFLAPPSIGFFTLKFSFSVGDQTVITEQGIMVQK